MTPGGLLPGAGLPGRTGRAQSINLDRVCHLSETVLLGRPRGPGFHGRGFNFHGFAAAAAKEVVVVAGDSAAAVDRLAVAVAQYIHEALVGKGLQNTVGRGQGNGDSLVLQDPVQFLRADEVMKLIQGGAYRKPLLRDPLLFPAGRNQRGQRPAVSAGAVWHEWTRFA